MEYETLEVRRQGGIGIIRLNRPERMNALSWRLMEELSAALGELGRDPDVRVLILTGDERAFSVGADLKEAAENGYRPVALSRGWGTSPLVFDEIERLDRVVIGAIAGYAVGGGCELALACDLRIATTTAVFALPEVKRGVMPAGGATVRLPRLIGAARAKEMMIFGDSIDAEAALRMGIVNKVVPPELLMEEAEAMARRILESPPLSVRAIKSCVNFGNEMSLDAGLEYEARVATILMQSEDFQEGIRAFVEKRAPEFKGR